MSAATNTKERFSLEFVTAGTEVAALKNLFSAVSVLPELVLFSAEDKEDSCQPAAVTTVDYYADPVEELSMLFGFAR